MVTLDLGCDNNKASSYFLGVDVAKSPQVDIIADAENLVMFNDNSVNAVFCRRCLQHIPNDLKALKEIHRVLTIDGVAIIEVASTKNVLVSKLLNSLKVKRFRYNTFHMYSESSLRQKLRDSNFKVLSYSHAKTHHGFWNHVFIISKMENQK